MARKLTIQERELRTIAEKVLDANVKKLAQSLGYWTYHTFRSIHSEPGWPDRVFIKGERFFVAELKKELGHPSLHQIECLDLLAAAGIETYLWRPGDWQNGEIESIFVDGPLPKHRSRWVTDAQFAEYVAARDHEDESGQPAIMFSRGRAFVPVVLQDMNK